MIKFLADVNVEKPIIDYLRKNGFDVKWIPDFDCTLSDVKLLELANFEGRVLITNDKDFGELNFLQKKVNHGIILIRIKTQKTEDKIKMVKNLFENHIEHILKHFSVITLNKIRISEMEF